MPDPLVSSVKVLGVYTIQLSHTFCEITFNRFYYYMVVISHQTVRVTYPIEALTNLTKYLKPLLPISIAEIYILPSIATGCYVIQPSW